MVCVWQLVENSKQKSEKLLNERREKVMLELEKLRQRVDEFNDYGELDTMQQYVQDVAKVQRRIAEVQEQIAWINKVRRRVWRSRCSRCVSLCGHQCYADLFTHTNWPYFVRLNFQHMKVKKGIKKRHKCFKVCFVVCLFSSPEYPQFWVFGGKCISLMTSNCRSIGFCFALLCGLDTELSGLVFLLQSMNIHHFFWNPC